MPSNYFAGAREVSINGGRFGDDYSQNTVYRAPVHRINDNSRHTTNYGGYVNHGQHADGGGIINNHSPYTSSYTPPQYLGPRGANRPSPRPRSAPNFEEEFTQSSRNYNSRPRYPTQGSENYDDHDDFSDEEEPRYQPRPSAKMRTRRPQGEQSTSRDDSIEQELRNLSPEMQRYVRNLAKQQNGQSDLQDRLANMQIDDDGVQPSSAQSTSRVRPSNPGQSRGNMKQSAQSRSAEKYRNNQPEDDSGSDEELGGDYSLRNLNSNNISRTNIIDSHNDNSTRTEIIKTPNAR